MIPVKTQNVHFPRTVHFEPFEIQAIFMKLYFLSSQEI